MTRLQAAALGCVSLLVLASCQTPESTEPATPVAAATSALAAPAAPPVSPSTSPNTPTPQPVASATGPHPGEAVYKASCATCHDNPEATRSPSRDNLKGMSFQFVNYSLTQGKMKDMAAGLTAVQRADVVSYVTGRDTSKTVDWAPGMMCTGARAAVDLEGPDAATSTHFGFDSSNTRRLSAKQAGLTTAQMSNMELSWSIAFPDATIMRSQGAIVGKNLFYPVTDAGKLYAFDLEDKSKPCVQWVYTAPGGAPLRTSIAYGVLGDGTPLLVFSGLDSTVHAVDPRTGKALWTKPVGTYSHSMTTGTPSVLKDRVIVPVAQFEISVAADNNHDCCTNHGYVLSLDPKTGAQQWRYDTMEDAKPLRDRGDGKQLKGPSGAPVWNSPLVDEKRGLVFFATGESNSPPAHKNTNAVVAIDLKTGKEKWSFHATKDDIFNSGCGLNPQPTRLNCVKAPETVYRDVDFGASVILGKQSGGKELLYAGQKSGSVWAFEPDTGKVVWRKALGTGGALGGIHWGIAFDNDTVYAPITNVGRAIPGEWDGDPSIKPGLYALSAKTGAIKWQFNPEPPAGTPAPAPGTRGGWRGNVFSTAPAVIDGAVVAAALDGTIYVVDSKTGKLLWSYQTAKEYDGVNGVKGKGGAIDSNSITAANGLLLVNSGYGMFGQAGGNMLLAFKPKT
ncbi:MAG: PQQ-binding-like beta-propeller repeat protein [Hyphomonadaceae bacterium]|nr:PQQ-binding-like beta-propeller repeat protein [Hyphomonadaceae bacterium]